MSDLSNLAARLVKAREEYERETLLPVDDFELTLGLEVQATWVNGFAATRDSPEEPAGYEVEKVFCKGRDITFLFSDEDMERLGDALDLG